MQYSRIISITFIIQNPEKKIIREGPGSVISPGGVPFRVESRVLGCRPVGFLLLRFPRAPTPVPPASPLLSPWKLVLASFCLQGPPLRNPQGDCLTSSELTQTHLLKAAASSLYSLSGTSVPLQRLKEVLLFFPPQITF